MRIRKNAVSQKEPVFTEDSIKSLISGEYIEKFALEFHKNYREGHRCVQVFTNVFRKMLIPFADMHDLDISRNLVIQLAKRIIEMENTADVGFAQTFLETIFIIWEEVQGGAHTICGFHELFEKLFEVKYHKKAGGEYWPWSFDSFLGVCICGSRKSDDYDFDFFKFTMELIFNDYFTDFLLEASEDSIKFLKRLDDDGFFMAGNMLHEMASQGRITFDCYDAVEYVAEYFPELRVDLYNSVLNSILSDNDEAKEWFDVYILDILQKMADYTKYQGMTFNIKTTWKKIIDCIFESANGITLNNVSSFLIEEFNIPRKEIESYIDEKTWELMMSAYSLEDVDYASIYSKVIGQLPNEMVYKLVDIRSMEKCIYGN